VAESSNALPHLAAALAKAVKMGFKDIRLMIFRLLSDFFGQLEKGRFLRFLSRMSCPFLNAGYTKSELSNVTTRKERKVF
jgi:hypothetical protein